jgi:hypothetical protein
MTQKDSVGRSALIAIVTGALFAGFVMIAPRLVASTQSAPSEPSLAPMVAAAHMTRIVHDLPNDPATTSTTAPEAPATTEAPSHTTTTEAPRPRVGGVPDGTVMLAASIAPPGDGKEAEVIRDGDEVTWTIRVTATDDELWGIYVFLEGTGHVPCDTKHLEIGETATCVASDRVYDDEAQGEVWVDAWTADRWVTDTIFPEYTVAP